MVNRPVEDLIIRLETVKDWTYKGVISLEFLTTFMETNDYSMFDTQSMFRVPEKASIPAEIWEHAIQTVKFLALKAEKDDAERLEAEGSYDRAAVLASLPNTLTLSEWSNCLLYFNNQCANCGSTKRIEKDHYVPVRYDRKIGTTKYNIIPLCRVCNLKKNALMPGQVTVA